MGEWVGTLQHLVDPKSRDSSEASVRDDIGVDLPHFDEEITRRADQERDRKNPGPGAAGRSILFMYMDSSQSCQGARNVRQHLQTLSNSHFRNSVISKRLITDQIHSYPTEATPHGGFSPSKNISCGLCFPWLYLKRSNLTNDPVPARCLHEVQASVCSLEKIRRPPPDAVVRKRGDAEACGNILPRFSGRENDIGAFDLFPHFPQPQRRKPYRRRRIHDKFFPAIADHGILPPGPSSGDGRRIHSRVLSPPDAHRHVERFEMIDVGEEIEKGVSLRIKSPPVGDDVHRGISGSSTRQAVYSCMALHCLINVEQDAFRRRQRHDGRKKMMMSCP